MGASNLPAALQTVGFSGREYVPLSSWARHYNFDLKWIAPKTALHVSSRWSTLQFACDSTRSVLNDVALHLSFPIALRGVDALISALDVSKAIHPILFPPRNKARIPVIHVCLDPGHGGKDPGKHAGKLYEKTYTLQLTQALRARLERAGFKVTQTRHNDVFIPPGDRPKLAARLGADLFLSLHFNGTVSGREEVQGSELYAFTPVGASSTNARGEGTEYKPSPGNQNDEKNILLAYQIQKSLTRSLSAKDRGVRRARFAVLREAEMPAVLIEAGYLSHPAESRRISSPGYLDKTAQAILDGVLAYRRLVER